MNLVVGAHLPVSTHAKKIGIQLAHAGVIVLLVGQLATDMLAREMQMHFAEGETRNYSDSATRIRTDFRLRRRGARPSRPRLLKPGDELKIDSLPFTIRVKSAWKNSDVEFPRADDAERPAAHDQRHRDEF